MFENLLKFDFFEIIEVVIRGVLSLIILFLATKMLGKKQVSELSLFDYVIGISIGNFAAEITMNVDNQYINGIVAILVFAILAYIVAIITMKSIILRRFFIGVPTIIIQNGKIIRENMKKVKMDINDLLEQCRQNNYFDISEVEYAIVEVNGKISFLPKGENKPLTIKDMNLKIEKQGLCANVIIDGKIMTNNLINMNKDEKWLEKELKIKGYSINSILLATLDMNEKIVIYPKVNNEKICDVLE